MELEAPFIVACEVCGRVWKPHPKRYLVPCCNEPPRLIGEGHPLFMVPASVTRKPRTDGRPTIRAYVKDVGSVSLAMMDEAEARGWIVTHRAWHWPIEPE